MHFDILYTWANAHMYLCTACFGMKRTGGSVGKTGWRKKKRKKKKGLYDSHNSTEHIVQLTNRPVPLRPYHWLTELDSDSCSVIHCNASQGQEHSMGTFQWVPPYQLQNSCQTLRSLDTEFNSQGCTLISKFFLIQVLWFETAFNAAQHRAGFSHPHPSFLSANFLPMDLPRHLWAKLTLCTSLTKH